MRKKKQSKRKLNEYLLVEVSREIYRRTGWKNEMVNIPGRAPLVNLDLPPEFAHYDPETQAIVAEKMDGCDRFWTICDKIERMPKFRLLSYYTLDEVIEDLLKHSVINKPEGCNI